MAMTANLPVEHTASAVLATRPAHSLTLPNEVLTMIASECDPADLKNMRLASKLMHQVSTQPFARKKFSRRRFIFTYQSMKVLVDITAHPVFGPHLTCLTFGTCRLDERVYQYHDEHDERAVRLDMTIAMHRAFVSNKHHIKMLTLALRNLKECRNNRVFLGLHDDMHQGGARRRGYAFEASYLGFNPLRVAIQETFRAVMEARKLSEHPLKTLKICLSSSTTSLEDLENFGTRSKDMIRSLSYKTTSGSSENMDLHFNVWRSASYSKLKILSGFTRLELSRHSLGGWANTVPLMDFHPLTYPTIWPAIAQSALQSIFIETSDVVFDRLVKFLQHYGNSLKKLELRQIHMFAFEPPTALALRFLGFLRSSLKLIQLSIEGFEVGQTIMIPEYGKMVFEGKDKVVEGLENLIEEVDEVYEDEPEPGSEVEWTDS